MATTDTHADLSTSTKTATVGLLLQALDPVLREIRELKQRVAELEAQPFAYDGPFEGGKTYRKGTFTTHDGSLWHCNYKTASRPGDGPAWTLAVKRGRDGKDTPR